MTTPQNLRGIGWWSTIQLEIMRMNRRKFLTSVVGASPLLTFSLFGKDQGKGKGRNKHYQNDNDQGGDRDSHHFRREDYVVIQRYYDGPRDLPPGLRKKYYRT